jgi:dihydroflavonol-4-reductase
MSKVFLTGATGFIGGNLVGKLLEKGYQVKVLVRDKEKLKPHFWKDKVEIIEGDITDPKSFKGKINDCEIIIHCAAIIAWWNKMWDKIYNINVTGTRNVLNEALSYKCKKFVHISSVAAIGYGENNEPIDETHPYNWGKHNIVYMETKHEAANEVEKAIEKGLNACMVNPANVWGVGDYRGRRVKLLKALKFGFPFYLIGGTNFVDVEAVCEATVNAIEHGRCGEKYILGGDNLELKEFLEIVSNEVDARKPFLRLPKAFVVLFAYIQDPFARLFNFQPRPTISQIPLFGKGVYYDSSKAMKELKMPYVSFKECIKKTVNFYKENNLL